MTWLNPDRRDQQHYVHSVMRPRTTAYTLATASQRAPARVRAGATASSSLTCGRLRAQLAGVRTQHAAASASLNCGIPAAEGGKRGCEARRIVREGR